MKFLAILSLLFLLCSCQKLPIENTELPYSSSTPEALDSSSQNILSNESKETELENGVYILDGIPYWRKGSNKPLLEESPLAHKDMEASRRRWLGRGGKPYQYSSLVNMIFMPEQIDQMTPEDAASFSYRRNDGGGPSPLDELPPASQEKLLELGIEREVLDYLLCGDLSAEFLLSLEEEQKKAFQELFTPTSLTDKKLEEMGMIHPRRTMTSTEEELRLVLSQPSGEDFRRQANELDIPHWMQDELLKRGNLRSEILSMTTEERQAALIPAASNYLYYNTLNAPKETLQLTQEGYRFIQIRCAQKGVLEEELLNLQFLGYTNYDKVTLSNEEWEFLFPLAELPEKLNQYGFSDEEIARYELRLKYLVREALEIRRTLA